MWTSESLRAITDRTNVGRPWVVVQIHMCHGTELLQESFRDFEQKKYKRTTGEA